MAGPGQGCTCDCPCHVHSGGKCSGSARVGTTFCFGCLSEHGCDREHEYAAAQRAAADERERRAKAAKAMKV